MNIKYLTVVLHTHSVGYECLVIATRVCAVPRANGSDHMIKGNAAFRQETQHF